MNAPEVLMHARAEPEDGGPASGVRVLLALTSIAVLWSEYRGRAPTAAPWSAWTLLLSGTTLLASSTLQTRSALTLASLSTLTTKLHLASTLHPAASPASRKLLQPGALLTALTAVPVVALGCMPVACKGPGCFPAESWVSLARIVAGFSTFMDLVFVGIALPMLKRPFGARERRAETLAIASGAAAFTAGLIKLTKFTPITTNSTLHGPLLLWTTAESCLTILSATAMAPHTAHERVKRPRSPPPADDGAGGCALGREERGEAAASESKVLYRSMVRAGLL